MNPLFVSSMPSQSNTQSGDCVLPQQESSDWRAKATAVYAAATDAARQRLRRCLAERLLALIGYAPPKETIVVDAVGRSASVALDGALFLLRRDELVIVRPCAYCETGRFESEPLDSQADLGYVLAIWAPYHHDCEPVDPPDDVSW
jgi:hypothetical protein